MSTNNTYTFTVPLLDAITQHTKSTDNAVIELMLIIIISMGLVTSALEIRYKCSAQTEY